MLFRRREDDSWKQRLRLMVWPRRSWRRSVRYTMCRLGRLKATPHAIAIGAASGMFVSFTPFIGLHFLLGAFIAWALGGSVIASALGTFVGNPVTFPFIWISAYQLGSWMLGERAVREHIDLSSGIFQSSLDHLWPLIKPMTVGGAPMGLVVSVIGYYLVRRMVLAFQNKRQDLIRLAPGRTGARTLGGKVYRS